MKAKTVDPRALRAELGLTREQLAARVGCSVTHLAQLERQPQLMTRGMAVRLAPVLGVEVVELLALRKAAS